MVGEYRPCSEDKLTVTLSATHSKFRFTVSRASAVTSFSSRYTCLSFINLLSPAGHSLHESLSITSASNISPVTHCLFGCCFILYQTIPCFNDHWKSFGKHCRNGENAGKPNFLLFLQCLLLHQAQTMPFKVKFQPR